MVNLKDGPAEGVSLVLRRAPIYLRVTFNHRVANRVCSRGSSERKWDALDQLDDEPKPHETVWVYKRVTPPTRYHMKAGRSSGWYVMADYRLHSVQPPDHVTRSNAEWQAWSWLQTKLPGDDDDATKVLQHPEGKSQARGELPGAQAPAGREESADA